MARNCGAGVEEVDLQPTSIEELINNAVIEHDLNMFNMVIDLGRSASMHSLIAGVRAQAPVTELDYSSLVVPPSIPSRNAGAGSTWISKRHSV